MAPSGESGRAVPPGPRDPDPDLGERRGPGGHGDVAPAGARPAGARRRRRLAGDDRGAGRGDRRDDGRARGRRPRGDDRARRRRPRLRDRAHGARRRRPSRLPRHPRRRVRLRRRRVLPGDEHRRRDPVRHPGVVRRLPHAAGPPLPGRARRLPRRLPRPAVRPRSGGDHRRRRLGRRQPRRRAHPAGPGRGPPPARGRSADDAGGRPHRHPATRSRPTSGSIPCSRAAPRRPSRCTPGTGT